MHDIDRTQLEFEADFDDGELDLLASPDAREAAAFSEADEMELAAELLAAADEQELDQFIGKLIGQAGEVAGQPVKGKTGSKLGSLLKGIAKKVLPTVAGAAGTLFGGPLGGMAASKLASAAGKAFGLELEGLSPEDQEFESARRFVRLAGEATRQAGKATGAVAAAADDPQAAQQVARHAVVTAARKFAPGLLRAAGDALTSEMSGPRGAPRARPRAPAAGGDAADGQSGRWVRQGGRIVLFGL